MPSLQFTPPSRCSFWLFPLGNARIASPPPFAVWTLDFEDLKKVAHRCCSFPLISESRGSGHSQPSCVWAHPSLPSFNRFVCVFLALTIPSCFCPFCRHLLRRPVCSSSTHRTILPVTLSPSLSLLRFPLSLSLSLLWWFVSSLAA